LLYQEEVTMDRRVAELALEALEKRKAQVEAEIAELRKAGKTRSLAVAAGRRRRPRTAAQKKAQSERMKAIWARRRKEAATSRSGTALQRGSFKNLKETAF
jgi:hypothetical protein